MRNTPSSFEVQHNGTRETGNNAPVSTPIPQRQRKVGLAVSALFSTVGLAAGCAQQEPAPAQSPAACQHDHTAQTDARRNRIMQDYQETRGGLPPGIDFSKKEDEAEELDTPDDTTALMLLIDDTKSAVIVRREQLGSRMDYLDSLLERVYQKTSEGKQFSPAEMEQIKADLQRIRANYLDAPVASSISPAPATAPQSGSTPELR